jgi:molecular chaperone GrpE
VLNVVEDGCGIAERVLGPAMVGVAKGGPKLVEPASD